MLPASVSAAVGLRDGFGAPRWGLGQGIGHGNPCARRKESKGEGRWKESLEQQGCNQSPSLSRLDKHCEDILLILVLRLGQVLPSGFSVAGSHVLWDIQGFLQCCLAAEAADLTADF